MAKFLLVLSLGLEVPSRKARFMQIGTLAAGDDEVHVFLVDDGVALVKKGITQALSYPLCHNAQGY